MLPYTHRPAEAGCTESRGYTHLGPPGTVPAAGQAWERQKQKTRFASRGRVLGQASGRAVVLGGRGGGPAPPAHAASRKAVAGLLRPAANPNTPPARSLQDQDPGPPPRGHSALEPAAEPGPRATRAAVGGWWAQEGAGAAAPLPCGDRRAQTLTVGDVAQTLGVEQVPQPRHLVLQLSDQLVVGVLVDDSVAADLLGPVGVPGRQGALGAARLAAEGTWSPACTHLWGTALQGLSTWGNQGPRKGGDRGGSSPHGDLFPLGPVAPGCTEQSNLHPSSMCSLPGGENALASRTCRHACPWGLIKDPQWLHGLQVGVNHSAESTALPASFRGPGATRGHKRWDTQEAREVLGALPATGSLEGPSGAGPLEAPAGSAPATPAPSGHTSGCSASRHS